LGCTQGQVGEVTFGECAPVGAGAARCVEGCHCAGLGGLGFTEGAFGFVTFGLDAVLFAAILLFGLLGSGLALGLSDAAQFFHAGSIAFALGAGASTKHREEVRAA
jgi:hypothetical protein